MSLLANSMSRAESAQAMARIVELANERLEAILDAYFPSLWRDDHDEHFDYDLGGRLA